MNIKFTDITKNQYCTTLASPRLPFESRQKISMNDDIISPLRNRFPEEDNEKEDTEKPVNIFLTIGNDVGEQASIYSYDFYRDYTFNASLGRFVYPGIKTADSILDVDYYITNSRDEADIIIDTDMTVTNQFYTTREKSNDKATIATVIDGTSILVSPTNLGNNIVTCCEKCDLNVEGIISTLFKQPDRILQGYSDEEVDELIKSNTIGPSSGNLTSCVKPLIDDLITLAQGNRSIIAMMAGVIRNGEAFHFHFFPGSDYFSFQSAYISLAIALSLYRINQEEKAEGDA